MEIYKLLSRFHDGRKKLKFVPTEKAFSSEISIKNSKSKLFLSGSLLICKHFYMRLLWLLFRLRITFLSPLLGFLTICYWVKVFESSFSFLKKFSSFRYDLYTSPCFKVFFPVFVWFIFRTQTEHEKWWSLFSLNNERFTSQIAKNLPVRKKTMVFVSSFVFPFFVSKGKNLNCFYFKNLVAKFEV